MLLMKKTNRPSSSATYGIIEPKGNPGNFRECVDKLPIRPIDTSVRACSAREGSGMSGLPGGEPPCCRVSTLGILHSGNCALLLEAGTMPSLAQNRHIG